ncbi:hypothetical protein BaRGS_00000471, partial [Batillaria attramentaria]
DEDDQRRKLRGAVIYVPNPVTWVLNRWNLAALRRKYDPGFYEDTFLEGARQAISYVLQLVSDGRCDQLNGLVTDEVMKWLQTFLSTLSEPERRALALEVSDMVLTKIHGISIDDKHGRAFVFVDTVCFALKVGDNRPFLVDMEISCCWECETSKGSSEEQVGGHIKRGLFCGVVDVAAGGARETSKGSSEEHILIQENQDAVPPIGKKRSPIPWRPERPVHTKEGFHRPGSGHHLVVPRRQRRIVGEPGRPTVQSPRPLPSLPPSPHLGYFLVRSGRSKKGSRSSSSTMISDQATNQSKSSVLSGPRLPTALQRYAVSDSSTSCVQHAGSLPPAQCVAADVEEPSEPSDVVTSDLSEPTGAAVNRKHSSSPSRYISHEQRAKARRESRSVQKDLTTGKPADTGKSPKKKGKRKKERRLYGPTDTRSCTDVMCLYIGICFAFFTTAVTAAVFIIGKDYHEHDHVPRDFWGNRCGRRNAEVKGARSNSGIDSRTMSLLFFPNVTIFSDRQRSSVGDAVSFCVHECPAQVMSTVVDLEMFVRRGSPLCGYNAAQIFQGDDNAEDETEAEEIHSGSKENEDEKALGLGKVYGRHLHCPKLPLNIHTEYRKHCIPRFAMEGDHSWLNVMLVSDDSFFEEYHHDVRRAWKEVLIMAAVAFGACYVLMVGMRFFHVFVTCFLCAFSFITIIATIMFLCQESASPRFMFYNIQLVKKLVGTGTYEELHQRFLGWVVAATILTPLLVSLLSVLVCGSLVRKAPFEKTVIITALILLIQMEYTGFLLALSEYCAHAKEQPVYLDNGRAVYHLPHTLQVWAFVQAVLAVWAIMFVSECHNFIVVYTTVIWYFRRKHLKKKSGTETSGDSSNAPIKDCKEKISARYHLGSVVLASILLPVVWLPRRLLLFLHGRVPGSFDQQEKSGGKVEGLYGALGGCWFCLAGYLCSLSRRAYGEIALHGERFCASAKRARQAEASEKADNWKPSQDSRDSTDDRCQTQPPINWVKTETEHASHQKEKAQPEMTTSGQYNTKKQAHSSTSSVRNSTNNAASTTTIGDPASVSKGVQNKQEEAQPAPFPGKDSRESGEAARVQQDRRHDTEGLSLLLLLTKLTLVPHVMLLGFFLLKDNDEITFIWAPLCFAGIVTFIIAHFCFVVIEVVAETTAVCHCEDLNNNPDPIRPYYPGKKEKKSSAPKKIKKTHHESQTKERQSLTSVDQNQVKNQESQAKDHLSQAKDHQSQATDHQSQVKGRQSQAKDHLSQAKDHQSQATDHQSQVKGRQSLAKDHQNHAKDHQSQPKYHQSQAKDHQSQMKGHQSQAKDHQSQTKDHQSQATDYHSQAKGRQSQVKRRQSQATDHQSQAKDHQSQTKDHQSQVTDHQSQATDHQSQTKGHQRQATDHQCQTKDHQSQAKDHHSQTKDHQSQATDHQSQAKDHQSQAKGHQSQAMDHQSQATDHQSQAKGRQSWAKGRQSHAKSRQSQAMDHQSQAEGHQSQVNVNPRQDLESKPKDHQSQEKGQRHKTSNFYEAPVTDTLGSCPSLVSEIWQG